MLLLLFAGAYPILPPIGEPALSAEEVSRLTLWVEERDRARLVAEVRDTARLVIKRREGG